MRAKDLWTNIFKQPRTRCKRARAKSDVAIELSRVEAAGGKVLMSRTLFTPEIGYMGLLLDSEGNRIAVHSHK